jgi:acetyl esterase/lipase
MHLSTLISTILLFLVVSSSLTYAEDKPRTKFAVETALNIAYRSDKDADPVRHKLDIFTPKDQKDFPVLFFVHGGAWRSGNKSLYPTLGKTFAEQGIGTVVINYRLSENDGKVKHPDHINDVAAAFTWVYENIGKYGGKKDRIFITGHSAGGHLVSLLATDESYLKAHKLSVAAIRGVLPLSGVYEIRHDVFVFKNQFGTDEKVCKAASPINNIKENLPPFLVIYADQDLPTLGKMAESFHAKLKESKCESSVLKVEKRDHISIIIKLSVDIADPATSAMLDFIGKHSEWKKK